ncbi:sensor histidine kinase [Mucilaginibacter angelicae]|uniref:histidine kinase n=1 Tax=Mucilaginibacter angelicae TaxID=869718 RepID=A0ABV6KZV3_9SPHI
MKLLLRALLPALILSYLALPAFARPNPQTAGLNKNSQIKNRLSRSDTASASEKRLPASKYHQEYKGINDSARSKSLEKQLAELQQQIDINKKHQHTQFLVQQAQIQRNRARNETTTRYIFITSLIMSGVFAGMMYNRYRIKKLSSDSLTAKQQEINDKNELLQILLTEKEWLLKEIHHRVKNNLQIVISLLNTQSSYLESEDALQAIRNSQQRMYAISLIHQKSYQSENMETIDIPDYICDLVEYLKEYFKNDKRIEFISDLEPLKLDVGQAVPLGLILNEAISNSVKYAFDSINSHNIITIQLSRINEWFYRLCIFDNGKGLPEGFDPDESNSLGINLMRGLAQQLNGELEIVSTGGLSVCVNFRAAGNDNLNNIPPG